MYRQRFGYVRRVFPVIHVADIGQTMRNLDLCLRRPSVAGAFLIVHGLGWESAAQIGIILQRAANRIAQIRPAFALGFNPLTYDTRDLQTIYRLLDEGRLPLWWSDPGGVDAHTVRYTRHPLQGWLAEQTPAPILFGGCLFKGQGQPPPAAIPRFVQMCARVQDVVTTSGPGTGHAADTRKIAWLRHALKPEKPLGIASGVTPANVADYLPYVDAILVASGIGRDFHNIEPKRLDALLSVVDAFNASAGGAGGAGGTDGAGGTVGGMGTAMAPDVGGGMEWAGRP